jgi:tetratricopeptide (TPR) repeat protein
VTVALLFANSVVNPVQAADTANETRAISQQVLALIKTSNLDEAETLAKRGLLLCEDAGDVKVFCVGQFNDSLGDIAYARSEYSSALAYYEQALRVREAGLGNGHLLTTRSQLRVGKAHMALHRGAEAEGFVKRAVAGFEKVTPVNRELAIALGYLRNIYLDADRIDDAVIIARRELDAYEKVGDKETTLISNTKRNLASILSRQAAFFLGKDRYSDAEPILIEAVKLIDPPPSGWEKTFAALQAQLGSLYERQRRYSEAEPFMLRALEYRTKVAAVADPEIPIMLSNLSLLYFNLQRPADSISYAVQAISRFDEGKQENRTLGFALLTLGRTQRTLDRLAEAEASLIRARDVLDRVLSEDDPQRLNARNEIGSLWIDQERFGEAEQIYQSALELEPKLARPATGWRSSVLAFLALVYREQARYADAERLILEAVKLDEAGGNERKPFLGQRLTELASILRRKNRYADAEVVLSRALTLEQPELDRAATLNALGVVYTTTDQNEKAETVLEEALAIRTKALPANSFFTVETIGNLAAVDSSRGHYADAEVKLRHVLEVIDASILSRSSSAALYSSLLSQTLVSEGKLDEAEALIRRSLDLYRQRLGADHPRFGGALKTLASIEQLRGRDRDAEDHYRQALAIDEKTIGPQSPAVAADLLSLVPLLKRTGRQQDAKADIARALAINTVQFGAESPMTAGAILASANMAYEAGQYADARQLVDRARRIQEQTFGPDHHAMAGNWIFAARLDIAQGKLDDAGAKMDRATKIIAKALPPEHPSNIAVLQGKADVAQALGRPADAEQSNRDVLAIAEKLYEPDHPIRRTAVDRLTGALWAQGKFADAEQVQRDQLSTVELKRGPDHPGTAIAVRGLANVLGSSGRQSEAAALYKRALAIDDRSFGPQSDQAALGHFSLGALLRRIGQFDEARTELNSARGAWESQGHLLAANSALEQLALLALDQGDPAAGLLYIERMLNIAEQTIGSDSPALAAVLAQLGRYDLFVGRNEAAQKIVLRINHLIGENPPEQAPGYLAVLQLRAQLDADRGDVAGAERLFNQVIAVATKYGGSQASAIGPNSYNLGAVYLKADRFQDAISCFAKALEIFKRENGDHAPLVGYTLLGAAQAYARIGDAASSNALLATAIEILGPTLAAQRPQPRWL